MKLKQSSKMVPKAQKQAKKVTLLVLLSSIDLLPPLNPGLPPDDPETPEEHPEDDPDEPDDPPWVKPTVVWERPV